MQAYPPSPSFWKRVICPKTACTLIPATYRQADTREESLDEEIIDPDEDAQEDPAPPASARPRQRTLLSSCTRLCRRPWRSGSRACQRRRSPSRWTVSGRVWGTPDPAEARRPRSSGDTWRPWQQKIEAHRPPATLQAPTSQAGPSQADGPVEPTEKRADWCYTCEAPMQKRGKQGDTWYSHRVNGEYCCGYGPGKKK